MKCKTATSVAVFVFVSVKTGGKGLHLAGVRYVIILVGSNECTDSMLLRLITDFNAHGHCKVV